MKKWWPVLVAAIVLTAAVAAFLRKSGEDTVSVRREVPATAAATETTPAFGDAATKTPRPKSAKPQSCGAIRIYAFSGGVAVAGCTVQLVHETTGARIEAVTDAAGTAEIPKAPVGCWQIGARHGSCVPVDREVDVVEGRTADVSLELALGGRIVGRVVDASGRPIPDAEAFLLEGEAELGPAFRTACDENGAFEIEGVPLTTLGICATAEHYKPRVQTGLTLSTPGGSLSVEIRLDAGTFISGQVVDDLGKPVPGALLTAGNEFVRAARADGDGRFTISGLGDQAMHMSAAASSHGTVYLHDVRPNTEGLVVRLPRGGAVEGRVAGEGTAVLISRWDEYWRREQVVATFALQEGAAFRLDHLAPGSYQIWAEGPGASSDKQTIEIRPDAVTGGVTLPMIRK